MKPRIAIVGAGVSGLTCGVVFAERGYDVAIFADETGQRTTSAVAAAIWFPYDAEPADRVLAWALESYAIFQQLSAEAHSGVSMIELRTLSRGNKIAIPPWALDLGARPISSTEFVMTVPLADTTVYLNYLEHRLTSAGARMNMGIRLKKLEEVDGTFDYVINCAGIGARALVGDTDLEPHRGQVAIVEKMNLRHAVVTDDPPLMYAIPRTNDCVFGGTNELSDSRVADSATTARIVAECSCVLGIERPNVIGERVGLRPYRKSGVRIERMRLDDGRIVIHNYGHGGSGFTLSWACAAEVLALAEAVP